MADFGRAPANLLQQLGELVQSVKDLQRRLDAIDGVLSRVPTRDE